MLTRRTALWLLGAAPLASCKHLAGAQQSAIAEEDFVSAGGIEQWVAIRGANAESPAMLFLHGGPCETQSPVLSLFAPWEERYVVAQWDQRGAGRTFGRNAQAAVVPTLEQIAADGVAIAEYVLERLGRRQLILVGHSWGAIVGLSVARLRPDLFSAFVATGLPINGRRIIEGMRESAVERAEAAGDAQAVTQLNALVPSDYADIGKLNVVFRWAAPFPAVDEGYLATRRTLLGTPAAPASVAAADLFAANPVCLPQLMPAVVGFDAGASGHDLAVPFFVVQGRDDTRTPPQAARAYVDSVRAPAKGYTEIAGGHFACFTNTPGFSRRARKHRRQARHPLIAPEGREQTRRARVRQRRPRRSIQIAVEHLGNEMALAQAVVRRGCLERGLQAATSM